MGLNPEGLQQEGGLLIRFRIKPDIWPLLGRGSHGAIRLTSGYEFILLPRVPYTPLPMGGVSGENFNTKQGLGKQGECRDNPLSRCRRKAPGQRAAVALRECCATQESPYTQAVAVRST